MDKMQCSNHKLGGYAAWETIMKNTLFNATLAAALLGSCSAAFANTGYSQDKKIAEDKAPNHIFAVTAESTPGAEGANLLIYDDDKARYESLKYVYGGYTTNEASASNNLVTMSGGKVTEWLGGGYASSEGQAWNNRVVISGGEITGTVAGGFANGNGDANGNTVDICGSCLVDKVYGGGTQNGSATGNTVTISGGRVKNYLVGGFSNGEGDVIGNKAIMTGGDVENLCGAFFTKAQSITGNKVLISGGNVGTARGYSQHSSKEKYENNVIIMSGGTAGVLQFAERIHLAGAGFDGTIEGVEHIVGQALDCGTVGYCDSIDIYGSQISGTGLTARVALNFHLMSGLLTEVAPMVTLGGELTLSRDLTLSFDALDCVEWEPGDSVTLVEAPNGMSIAPELLAKEYNIYQNGDPHKIIMATARLELNQDKTMLMLTVQKVPEPATGTLGLLALAALCMRRRRKCSPPAAMR